MAEIGVYGLGTMGAALALNIADNGFNIAVSNRSPEKVTAFLDEAGSLRERITGGRDIPEFLNALERPRNIILMVPAGRAVDDTMEALIPHLDRGDLIVDAGNANFHDTIRRAQDAKSADHLFLGVGVSGGEDGARHGPSIMAGGDKDAWARIERVMTAIAATYEGTPCATYMGPGGAGHFVKTVHNGIEYADMQMIAEAYGLMRDGLGMDAGKIAAVFEKWNGGLLQSYLMEISGEVAKAKDPVSGNWMLDMILDTAGQKGTGRWTAIEALHLAAPATVIEAAVAARNLSSRREERQRGAEIFGGDVSPVEAAVLGRLEDALLAGKIACYAQGFGLLAAASQEHDWKLPLPEIAKVWRAGCIIRSTMLNDMAEALATSGDQNLMFAPYIAGLLQKSVGGLRSVVMTGAGSGLAMPALSAALAHFDNLRTPRTTANLLQAQRDFFGAHTFERVDEAGAHRGPWAK